ncbi:MAG: winged helix-turn-helix domain-containing protein [Candidatus Dojkabacteria bacterium]|nr:winged helix-turn-helix domain-containing protein [Candidatus Dojkabacteria bacterium]
MKTFINASIIEKLPEKHFGKITEEVLHNLLNGQCTGIYGIPGYGMDYFAKQISLLIENNYPKVKTILLNPELDNDKVKVLSKELAVFLKSTKIDEISISKYLKNNKIVIILSEIYNWRHKSLFKFLSAVRELNQQSFTVLTVADYSLFKNTNKYLEIANNLFTPLRQIRNFDLSGVKRIIKINNEEYRWNTPLSLSRKILFLSGGNPALVYCICMAMYYEGEKILDHPEKLAKYQPLNFRLSEIARLITILTIEEQIQLGILNNNGTLFSELLSTYFKEIEFEGMDKLFPDLTKTERKILTIFVQNKGKIVDKDQLSIVLGQKANTYSEWAIYKAVARVREKTKDRYIIKTLKGRGWRME